MARSIGLCLLSLIAASICLWSPGAGAQQENRVALVIGNGAYTNAEALRNPVNDAREMARVLRASGFEVIVRENATRRVLTEALSEFAGKITPGGVGLFYFAGHGFQVRGANYLVPVDATLGTEYDVKYETLDINDVLSRLDEARARLSLVILDACRDNPFSRRFRSTGTRGLAQIDAPRGTVIAYATAPGETAADGDGSNGVYTGELLKAIGTPGLKLEDVFKRTIDGVARVSGNRQTPWVSSSFRGEFYFVAPPSPPPRVAASTTAPPPAPLPPPPPMMSSTSPEALELAAWSAVSSSSNPAIYEAFLHRFPDGIYAGIARVRLEELRVAARARDQVDEAARRKADADAEARLAAAEEARRRSDAAAEAKRTAADEARRKADADAEAKRVAADEARRKADADAETRRQAMDDERRKADANTDAKLNAERVEQALQLSEPQRRRIQGALTVKGFDTAGTDGSFGPRTRLMIASFQRSIKEEPTGYLTAAQHVALLRDTEQGWLRMEQERQRADEQRKTGRPASAGPVAPGARDGAWRITASCPEATFSSFTVRGGSVSAYVSLKGHDGQANSFPFTPVVVSVSGAVQADGSFTLSYASDLSVSGSVSADAITGTVSMPRISKRCPLAGRR